ncbi:uncharacterized protein LOC132883105 [Neoarius graeffei]|uniref:uncharacterized protein LOC132883105 n=2 Tax=Neoarius graeffei TaxID=443677 RepID=UPI00298CA647|nr:uncharacterized protein LOC132883105 [Neoarius graeffei]XP_060772290.1 uncharacterized protein LOC132883105 [Neoarius graeffei]
MSDFVKFMARREIIATGLLQFDDRPENYRAWKASFLNTTTSLNLSAKEEMDLLVKWLGKESGEQAKRIRGVHAYNPARGLDMIWQRLDECFGAPEVIESALLKKVDSFPKISNRDWKKLRELGDLLMELQAAKLEGVLSGLACLDTARGIANIVHKLPFTMQERWMVLGYTFKKQHGVSFPPFSVLVDFISEQAKMRNDPSFSLPHYADHAKSDHLKNTNRMSVAVHKTDVSPQKTDTTRAHIDPAKHCPIHKKPHPIHKCRSFRDKSLEDRKALLKLNGICFKCLASTTHLARDCDKEIKCIECGSERHHSALHPGPTPEFSKALTPADAHGGEGSDSNKEDLSALCTEVCGTQLSGKSCSKICLVKVFPSGQQDKAVKVYAVIDDQSNRSLVKPEFFDVFDVSCQSLPYRLKTCAGVAEASGRRACGFQISSMDGHVTLPLPTLIECNNIPDNRSEIPTPQAAHHHSHLRPIAGQIPELDHDAQIMMLLGRDIIRVHKVRRQINGSHDAPYAQKLDLGWVLVGNVCLGRVHKPPSVNVFFTNTLDNGRQSLFEPCPNTLLVKESVCNTSPPNAPTRVPEKKVSQDMSRPHLGDDIFQRTDHDEKLAHSFEDTTFLHIMKEGVYKDEESSWVAPLPFKPQRRRLPNNKGQTLNRFKSLEKSFSRKPDMKDHFFGFMEKILEQGHAEVAPPLKEHEECWYLPLFGVYHPKKPGQIRVVFDSSCQHDGVSLNDVLLTGPDLNNSLLGVLIRFRREAIAITTDIQQMFHCFVVRPQDRNFLRFFWYRDNDESKGVIEFRMKVHVFGNSPSPSVAIYGLRQAAKEGEAEYGEDAREFVERDFYIDDGLKSLPSAAVAIDLLKRTQEMLACSNLRLHKITSNSEEVMKAFPTEDHASGLRDLNLGQDTLPVQRTLGVTWDLKSDTFTFQVSGDKKPFTRRGVLSTINGLYDPLGFAAPVVIRGKALLRDLTADTRDWDAPLPSDKQVLWDQWRDSLQGLQALKIPRPYTQTSPSAALHRELCVFSDASILAIGAVAYLRVTDQGGGLHVGFILGKAKLAPRPDLTIPRLELCAAVLAVDIAETIKAEMDIPVDKVTFFTDSKIVLGYINNEKRRFYVFVNNRVQRIRRSSEPQQWRYVASNQNPADLATRSVPAARLKDTTWLTGPSFLTRSEQSTYSADNFDLVNPDEDADVRPEVTALSTTAEEHHLDTQRFERFSTLKALFRSVASLIHIASSFKRDPLKEPGDCKGWHYCAESHNTDNLSKAKNVIIKAVQEEAYQEELQCIRNKKNIPKDSPLLTLNPVMGEDGILRVGGRISQANISPGEKNPIIIPGRHHLAVLIVRHYHEQCQHQGRHLTEGAVRVAGYWIVGAKRCVSSLIFKCVTCRRLRGKCEVQKMADLPSDRVSMEPPFTYVGVDVFGPWTVSTRRTRGGHANDKRWAVLFTCLSVRAIHIEIIESMDTSSFINAVRRFIAIRGPVKQMRSDRGTNFVGACKELNISSNLDESKVSQFLADQGCKWTFNPPHASHMGGAWERMIGVTRSILDSMMLQIGPSRITHEVLATFMAEASAIVNSRPLIPVSTDPDDPSVLAPTSLLTQKLGPTPVPSGEFRGKDLFRRQWKQVQSLASTFWDRWRKQYLSTLQPRRKWQADKQNITVGTVVLMKDCQSKRNDWPLARITKVFPSEDGRVRKVEVKVADKEGVKLFLRPITQVITLLPSE